MSGWTAEQVAALAPDPASAKAGQGLAAPAKWVSAGRDARAFWGECSGSGAKPYQVSVDTVGPAFRCSCPSRKFPCKHGLGLLFLHAARPGAVAEGAQPAWVAEWIAGRDEKSEKQAAKAAAPPAESAPDPEAQAKRAARREERVAAGMEELERWLEDLVRQGLASLPSRPPSFWETPAARLVDAQAPGAARRVRQLSAVAHSGDGWPERMLERLSLLHLLARAYARIDALPEASREDVRAALGFTLRQEDAAAGEGVRDQWAVLGQRVEEEDRLTVRRTWLWGRSTGRSALLLAFAAGRQPLEPGPPPGTEMDAELAFYPGAAPLRAVVRTRAESHPLAEMPGHGSISDALAAYGAALAANPWTERIAVSLPSVVPVDGTRWMLRDHDGAVIPIHPSASAVGWPLLALAGGRPVGVFGEWDGDHLLPLSAFADGRFHPLAPSYAGGGE
ncbi:MAG TPA: SWIM zinc finger family protein [Longimicrobium sp.]|nr:SWIM zinc finger family protein [Longimicrobium sp.]